MMLRLEEMGVSITLEVAWQIETVGDAYRYCAQSTHLQNVRDLAHQVKRRLGSARDALSPGGNV